jgi:hypothetical protein
MKKIIQTSFFVVFAQFTFGQSVSIIPGKNIIENSFGDNIQIFSSSSVLGVQGLKYNGTSTAKTAVTNGSNLLLLGGGGYYNSSNFYFEKARINITASENWNSSSTGTIIGFSTTLNGTNSPIERMSISHNGNIGIGNINPTAKLHINNSLTSIPALHLESTGSTSNFITATSTVAGSAWNNYFFNSATAGANLVYWSNSNGNIPLVLDGEGNAAIQKNLFVGYPYLGTPDPTVKLSVAGFTKLGNDGPSIKMKTFTSTTSSTEGGDVFFAHGLNLAKIIDYTVLVDEGGGILVKEGHLRFAGRQFDTEVNSVNVRVFNHATNSENILSKTIKVLITYTE